MNHAAGFVAGVRRIAPVATGHVVRQSRANTVNGQAVDSRVDGDKVRVDDATVVNTDIKVRTGIIHVIDAVLLPD